MKNKGTDLFVYSTDPSYKPNVQEDVEEIVEPSKQDVCVTRRQL